jgi:hypothetical protein
VLTAVYPVASTTWAETTVTWNNKPPAGGTALDTIAVGGTTGAWYELNLTAYAQQQRSAGQTVISVVLKGTADTLPYVTLGSRESGNAPRLLIFP